MFFIKFYHFFIHFLTITFMPFLDDLNVRLYFVHPFHRLKAFVCEWGEDNFNDDSYKYDGPPIVVKYVIEILEYFK